MSKKRKPKTAQLQDPPAPEPTALDEAATLPEERLEAEREDGEDVAAVAEPEEQPVRRLEEELDSVRDQLLRTAADFDNFRKRTVKERSELWGRAQAALATRILDALDDLSRVVELEVNSEADVVLEGVRMVERKLLKELSEAGLERIGSPGERFDPNEHEAVGTVPAEDPNDDGTVAEVFQVGYRFGAALLRPARVRVAVTQGDTA